MIEKNFIRNLEFRLKKFKIIRGLLGSPQKNLNLLLIAMREIKQIINNNRMRIL